VFTAMWHSSVKEGQSADVRCGKIRSSRVVMDGEDQRSVTT